MAPREGHIKRTVKIFGYLQKSTRIWKSIVISPEDTRETSGKGANTADWLEKYPKAS